MVTFRSSCDERHRGYVLGVLSPAIDARPSHEEVGEGLGVGALRDLAAVLMTVFVLDRPFWVGISLGVCLVAVGTAGDLVESMIKRDLGSRT